MSLDRRRALWRVVQLALLAAVLYGLYRALAGELGRLTWSDVTRHRPDPLLLAVSVAILLLVYLAHAFFWRVILRDLHIGNPSARETIHVYFLAGLGRYIPGRLWLVAGFALLAKRAGLPAVAATAAQVLAQMAFLSTGVLFLALTLPNWQQALGETAASALTVGSIVLVVSAGAIWLLVATPLGHGFRDALAGRLHGRAGERLNAAFALADQVTLRLAVKWALAYGLSWIAFGVAFALFAISFVPDAAGSWRFLAGAVAASYLGGYIFVIAPAGLGVREGFMFVLLQQVMAEPGAALVVSALSRFWFTAGELVPLALLTVLPQRRPEEGRIEFR